MPTQKPECQRKLIESILASSLSLNEKRAAIDGVNREFESRNYPTSVNDISSLMTWFTTLEGDIFWRKIYDATTPTMEL